MFTKLPLDIQEKIYNLLPVDSRVSLSMALPKDAPKKFIKDKKEERKLGVLVKAIKKKKFKKLTPVSKEFISKLDKSDPTLDEISQHIPEVKELLENNNKTSTLNDIEYVLKNDKHTRPDILASQIMKHDAYINVDTRPYLLYICLVSNHHVFEAMYASGADVSGIKNYIQFTSHDLKLFKFTWKYVEKNLTQDEFDVLYEKIVGDMRIDCVLYLDERTRLLNELPAI